MPVLRRYRPRDLRECENDQEESGVFLHGALWGKRGSGLSLPRCLGTTTRFAAFMAFARLHSRIHVTRARVLGEDDRTLQPDT